MQILSERDFFKEKTLWLGFNEAKPNLAFSFFFLETPTNNIYRKITTKKHRCQIALPSS